MGKEWRKIGEGACLDVSVMLQEQKKQRLGERLTRIVVE